MPFWLNQFWLKSALKGSSHFGSSHPFCSLDGGWRHVSELGVRSGLVSWSMGTVVTAWGNWPVSLGCQVLVHGECWVGNVAGGVH